MSQRAYKRHVGREIHSIEESSSEDSGDEHVVQTRMNAFDLLNEEESEHTESESEHMESEGEQPETESESEHKGEGNHAKEARQKDTASSNQNGSVEPHSDEEFEAALEQLKLSSGAGGNTQAQSQPSTQWKLFMCDSQLFDGEAELRKKFGSVVGSSSSSSSQRTRRLRPKKGFVLVVPQRTWPLMEKPGFTMEMVESNEGGKFFKYVHSTLYQQVQRKFIQAAATHLPEAISQVANLHPYHVDSLLILSDVCRFSGDLELAGQLVERALYVLETRWHPNFNVFSGECRLPYKFFENRCFHLAVFRHMNNLVRKGCPVAALEFCKFLFSLDPITDPLAAGLLSLDFMALRSHSYPFLKQFYRRFGRERKLNLQPNWVFNMTLCEFLEENNSSESPSNAKSTNLLRMAVISFPEVFLRLADKIALNFDRSVLANLVENGVDLSESQRNLEVLGRIFVERSNLLWKNDIVIRWLRQCLSRDEMAEWIEAHVEDHAKWLSIRVSHYGGDMPLSIYRHAALSDYQQFLQGNSRLLRDLNMADPFPPENSAKSPYDEPESAPSGLVESILRSILPWQT